MNGKNGLDAFAEKVLEVYHLGKDDFWSAVTAPFLANIHLMDLLKYRKVGMELMELFKNVDQERRAVLCDYTLPMGFDVNAWNSLNAKDEYFRDSYPIYAFLAIWMEEEGVREPLGKFGDILRAVVYGIAGYGILDVMVDGENFSPVELLTAQNLISEYETRILKVFGVTETNLNILHRIRDQFLKAEIKEKSVRKYASPYHKDRPIECGFKAAHLLTPFMLSLESIKKADLIDTYFDVFFLFGAVIQILDDIKDLEDDLSIGHFSYITLDTDAITLYKNGVSPKEIAEKLKQDRKSFITLYQTCKKLIDDANHLLLDLDDPFLARIVHVTELRLDSYFRKELQLNI